MDLELAIKAHPHIGIPFVLCILLSVSLLFAFAMQWNQYSMTLKKYAGLKRDWKKGMGLKALLFWLFAGDIPAAKAVWNESKGVRFILPLGLAFGAAAFLLYLALRNASSL